MSLEGKKKAIKSYRDLLVWQKAHSFAKEVIQKSKTFPRNTEATIIKKQLVGAAVSVPANIAEGYGGHKGSAYKNYLVIARRSATESDYWLFLSQDLKLINGESYQSLWEDYKEINAMLSSMIDKL